MAKGTPPLPFDEAVRILQLLRPLTDQRRIVVIGGQAIAFWQHQLERLGYLPAGEPLTSKDLDFRGTPDTVRRSAELLGGEPLIAGLDDHSPNTGLVKFVDSGGVRRTLDFIEAPLGLTSRDVLETAIQVELRHGGETVTVWVMHPERCLESRVHNVQTLGLDHPLALRQLDASIEITNAFSRFVLDSPELGTRQAVRVVLKINERVYRFARRRLGRQVFEDRRVDPFEAALADDPRLPKAFRKTRLPQMRAALARLPERRRRGWQQ